MTGLSQQHAALQAVPEQREQTPRNEAALQALAELARAQVQQLNWPAAGWSAPCSAPDGHEALDVLIVGAGMCGQTVALALRRAGVQRVRIIDRAACGQEGPWATYARMLTLRSPKHLTGPDVGVPALTLRAWFEAQHGRAAWEALHKVGRLDWRDYLLWVRRTMGVEVDNGVELLALDDVPATDNTPLLLRAHLAHSDGTSEVVYARHVVLASGRDGAGAPRWPAFASLQAWLQHQTQSQALDPGQVNGQFLPRLSPWALGASIFHSSDEVDFAALAAKHVAVLGVGASAFDNAACALEAGARVTQFARRSQLPQVNKSKWTSFAGFFHGFEHLSDAWRWRFYTYIFSQQVPPPWETVRRCTAHAGFALKLGTPWLDVRPESDGSVSVQTAQGWQHFDAVIFGTGFDVDVLQRPELQRWHTAIDTWAQHVSAQQAAEHPEAARFPYLGSGFALQASAHADERTRAALARLHLFNWGSTLSHGALAGDIPGLGVGAQRLAAGIAQSLFVQDVNVHWQALLAHEEPELEQTPFFVPATSRSSP